MKNKLRIIIFILMVCIGTTVAPQKAVAQVSVSFQVFYDDLSPYGNWVEYSNYGYVWVPNVGSGFRPYATNGYWVYTDEGWTWVSRYQWGWAPFHYGRWFYEPYYGWIWVPGNEWGPGWVSWRRSNDYYGWAPMGPGISIDIAYSNSYNLPYNQWTFVRNRDFGRPNINNYYVNNSNNVTIINNTTVINNTIVVNKRNVRYGAGPDRIEVEKHTGKMFKPVAFRETNKPAQNLHNGELEIFRPRVEKNDNAERKPSPSKVVKLENVKTSEKRTPEKQQEQQQQRKEQQNKQQEQQQNKQQEQQQQQRKEQQNKQQEQQQQQRKEQQNKQQEQQQQQRKEQQNKQQEQQQQQRKEQQNKQQEQQQQQRKEQQNKQQEQQQQQRKEQQNKQQEQQQNKQQEQQQQQNKEKPASHLRKKDKKDSQPQKQGVDRIQNIKTAFILPGSLVSKI